MITVLTIGIILIVGYSQLREGLFTACTGLVNVVLAGLVAFCFFEPFADWLEPNLAGNFLANMEDFLALVLLFCGSFVLLRSLTNYLAPEMIAFDGNVQYGGAVIGLLSGYLLAGFLICAVETLPVHENFFDFQPRQAGETGPRSVFPPDRLWLALMRHAGAHALSWEEADSGAESEYDRFNTFDKNASFELRYLRYRRHNDARGPIEYKREFDRELGRMP
jgi:hypothetical protein